MATEEHQGEVAPTTFKAFVGNLAYKTTEESLSSYFSKAGPVLSAILVVRGRRSVGYAFVEFADHATVQKAVELFNKTELDGREINVEHAKPREQRERRPRPPRQPRPPRTDAEGGERDGEEVPRRRNHRPRRPRFNNEAAPGDNADPPVPSGNAEDRPPRRRNYRRGPPRDREGGDAPQGGDGEEVPQRTGNFRRRRPQHDGGGDAHNDSAPQRTGGRPPRAHAEGEEGEHSAPRPRRRGPPADRHVDNENQDSSAPPPHRQRRGPPRRRRTPRPRAPDDDIPSKTFLFVANLPYVLDDAGLAGAFHDINIITARVVKDREGRSKGFGFVECANQEQQQAASVKVDGRPVNGRPLLVKIARLSSERKPEPVQEVSTQEAA